MTTLTIAPEYQAVIRQALASLSLGRPSGRVTLSVTFNVHNSKVGSIHIDTHSHEEVRL